jgi:hypothetical protein
MQMTLALPLISRHLGADLIHQRAADGYVNATAMCKAAGKRINDYVRLAATTEFMAELASVTGIPAADLVVSISGGRPEYQGTWVHPDVAINLAQWCSPKFAVAVSQWIREWIAGTIKAPLPYHLERYMANRSEIPTTHFSMLNELIFAMIAPLEEAGYSLPDDMLPDISTGRLFCKWLREEKGIDTDTLPTYKHRYADGRVVYPKLYPNQVLADFREYLNVTWIPKHAERYFEERDNRAIPFVKKLLLLEAPSKLLPAQPK